MFFFSKYRTWDTFCRTQAFFFFSKYFHSLAQTYSMMLQTRQATTRDEGLRILMPQSSSVQAFTESDWYAAMVRTRKRCCGSQSQQNWWERLVCLAATGNELWFPDRDGYGRDTRWIWHEYGYYTQKVKYLIGHDMVRYLFWGIRAT